MGDHRYVPVAVRPCGTARMRAEQHYRQCVTEVSQRLTGGGAKRSIGNVMAVLRIGQGRSRDADGKSH